MSLEKGATHSSERGSSPAGKNGGCTKPWNGGKSLAELSRVQSPSIKSGCAEQQSAIISLLPCMNSSVCTYRTMWDKN